ncbi:phenylacetate--CoA ligase family protein [Chthonomonas sp.]|uniref:phenylacetate--CoA ligase family protein n=1 Tax=Chthonomonas sp. TaxID=2282153 RepID=UPI0031F30C29
MSLEARPENVLTAYREFLTTPLDELLAPKPQTPEEHVLRLFHDTVAHVPAYRRFLNDQGIVRVQTFEDFQRLPVLTKQNYILQNPLDDLCRNGTFIECDMIATSSGSTGKPCIWPRFLTDELQIAVRFEQIFRDSFSAHQKPTLAVVCFALGTWVGGMYTTACCRHLAAKGYPITVATPGNNLEEIFRVVRELAPYFSQTVLLGYPPFIKNVVDQGLALGIEWSHYAIRWVTAGEVFSEEWRSLIGERVGSTSPLTDSASLYGTADAGVLANETPLSIAIRRWFADNPKAAEQIFGESRLPTLAQYDPYTRFFECSEGKLLFSGNNGIPLIRYNILDTGGVVPFEKLMAFLQDWRFDPLRELATCGLTYRKLPFVYVFGRSDFTLSYYGANIYPENVTVGLEQEPIKHWVTGRFVMEVREDADANRYLHVAVELAPHKTPTEEMIPQIAASIRQQLERLNTEFANYVPEHARTPEVSLHPTDDPAYFPKGVKHRYTRGIG